MHLEKADRKKALQSIPVLSEDDLYSEFPCLCGGNSTNHNFFFLIGEFPPFDLRKRKSEFTEQNKVREKCFTLTYQ